jgi:hypothetical protein
MQRFAVEQAGQRSWRDWSACLPKVVRFDAGAGQLAGDLQELELSLPQPLRRFLARVLMDPGIGSTFLACRASGRHHHPGKGGLVAHSLENLDLIATTVRRTLPGDPVSVAIAQLGYLLHDVGKIRTVGASKRPELHHVVRHETHNLLLLAPHLDWLHMQAADIYAGLSYVMEYVATPAAARSRARYFPAEVVVQFDQWSAAAHSCRDLKALCGAQRAKCEMPAKYLTQVGAAYPPSVRCCLNASTYGPIGPLASQSMPILRER